MAARAGPGPDAERAAADLHTVDWLDASGAAHVIWQASAPTLLDHNSNINLPRLDGSAAAPPSALTLHFHTPLRLQHQGHPLRPNNLTPRALVAALGRRIALVMEFHAGLTEWGAAVPALVQLAQWLHDERDLHWHDWTRYPSRQQQEMTLGGVLGRWPLRGSPASNVDCVNVFKPALNSKGLRRWH